jgi:hypothetical protein
MAKSESELFVAANAFDEALASYERLGDLFLRAPLDTLKHLERANATLNDLADAEQRLQASGQLLVAAIAGARDRQQAISQQVVDRAPALQARNAQLGEMMKALQEITADVGRLNEEMFGTGVAPSQHADMSTAMFAMSERAEQLSRSARANEFSDLADQAHALFQRLQALAKKLKGAGEN